MWRLLLQYDNILDAYILFLVFNTEYLQRNFFRLATHRVVIELLELVHVQVSIRFSRATYGIENLL